MKAIEYSAAPKSATELGAPGSRGGSGQPYIKVQMFEPFQDRNPHFFGTVSLS